MKPRNLLESCSRGWLILLLLVFPAGAQEGFRPLDAAPTSRSVRSQPTSDQAVDNELAEALEKGIHLEREARWGEALSHYEDTARRFSDHPELQRRLTNARIHFDLSRRYADRSYLDSLTQLSEQQSLDLFAEVVLKIHSHYVQQPDWNATLQHGTNCLAIALLDQKFAKQYQLETTSQQVDPMVDYVRHVLAQRDVRNRRQAQELVRWIGRLASQRLRVPPTAVILEYVCGATSHLDAYSTFLTADQLDEVYSQIEGNFVGLGIELKTEKDSLLIANVIPDGPADEAGMLAGERIVGVDGVSTQDVSSERAADMLKGAQGTVVDVRLRAPDGTTRTLRIRRDRVEVPSVVDVRMIDRKSGVGYFKINSFQKTTSRDVDAALWKLHSQGMRSLIVDVRGNPGGLLNESVEVADRFIESGRIVATSGRSTRENFDYKAHRVGTWRVPLVVLIDGDSASASEIFAGAIRDHDRGQIVGNRSYGKGSVQGIFPLRVINGGVRLTTAKFYSPSGRAISEGGVQPTVLVRSAAKPIVDDWNARAVSLVQPQSKTDPVLSQAAGIAKRLVVATRSVEQAEQQQSSRSVQVDSRGRQLQRRAIGW